MTRRHKLGAVLLIAAGALVTMPRTSCGDAIVTMSDRRIEGKIVAEDADSLQIESPRYGQLRFFKRNLKTIERADSSAPAPPVATPSAAPPVEDGGSPFASDPASPPIAPMAPITNDDPFAGATVPAAASAPVDFSSAPSSSGTVDPARKAFAGNGVPLVPFASAPNDSPVSHGPAVPAMPGAFPDASAEDISAANPFSAGNIPAAPPQIRTSLLDAPDALPLFSPIAAAPVTTSANAEPVTRTGSPEIKMGSDGVIFGDFAETPIEVRQGETGKWSPSSVDVNFRAGVEIRSGAATSAHVSLRGKKDDLRLTDQTFITFEKISSSVDEVALVLQRGSIAGDIEERAKPDAFTIRTPEVTASVRGTRFIVERLQGATRVTALKGEVFVRAELTGVYATIPDGHSALINALGQILDVVKADDVLGMRWENWDGRMETTSPSFMTAVNKDTQDREASLLNYQRNVADVKYQNRLDELAKAFEKLAQDTKQIPTDEQGWSALRYNPGLANWNGPYLEGAIPPVDPWRRALVYKRIASESGRVFGRVYSLWQDGRDQGGENPSVDKVALVMYYNLEAFKNDPKVNPPASK